jgi:TNF receptor-associated factor 4
LQARVASLDGKLVLSEYQKKKQAAHGGIFQFPPFYTHPNGYRMALRVEANGWGSGKGTHVSVEAPIIEGLHDAELEWPFIGRVTFTLLNQLEDKNHYIRVVAFHATKNARVGSARGKSQFILHSALAHDPVRNIQYLKDDTLHFRMSVEVDRKL